MYLLVILVYIASLFPLHSIQLAMQIKMTDIIENSEGMSLEAISLFPKFPIYSNYHPHCPIYHSSKSLYPNEFPN